MEITEFGYVFLSVCFIGFFLSVKYLFAVTVFSCIFQSTAVINFPLIAGQPGAAPYVVSSVCFVLRTLLVLPLFSDIKKDRFVQRIAVFVVFATCVSFIYPYVWVGSDVYSYIVSHSVMDMGSAKNNFWVLPFGMRYILVFLSVYCAYKNRIKIPDDFIKKIFVMSVIVVVFTGFWEFTAKTTGMIDFPYEIIYNNAWYAQLYMQKAADGLMRLNSTFLEPSYCGAFLSASFWAIMVVDDVKYKWLCIPIGICLIFNLSGTGMLCFIFGFFIYTLFYLKNRIKYIISFFIIALLLIWIISEIGYFGNMESMVMGKKDSVSGIQRGTAAYLTWEVFLQTWGIGVGLGSIRGSSFLLSMLASLGVIGVFFLYKIYAYLKHIEVQNKWVIVFISIVLIGQCIAVPDLAYSIMRMYLLMGAALLPIKGIRVSKPCKIMSGGGGIIVTIVKTVPF